jgi:hypothetical protein
MVRCLVILGAVLFAWLMTTHCSPAQETPAEGQDNTGQDKNAQEKKPATAPAKPGGGAMMGKMMGQAQSQGATGGMSSMMGSMGGRMGMMGGVKPAHGTESTLEEMLNKALKDNPDIRVAEAKVREADAELNRTRLQVTQKVLAFHYSRESQRAVIKFAEENMTRIRKLNSTAAISQEDVKAAEQQLTAAKAKLAEIEAEMPYLLGQQHQMKVSSVAFSPDGQMLATTGADGTTKVWDAATGQQILVPFNVTPPARSSTVNSITFASPETGTIAQKLRKALETPVTLDYKDKSLAEIFEDLEKKVPGISFHAPAGRDIPMSLKGRYPLKAALELIEDTYGASEGTKWMKIRFTFVVRDYGLLFCPEDKIPPGALRLQILLTGQHYPLPEFQPGKGPSQSPPKEKTPLKEDKK